MRRLNLTRLVLSRDPNRPFPGDPCGVNGCTGHIKVYAKRDKPKIGKVVRYLECDTCGQKPEDNKFVADY